MKIRFTKVQYNYFFKRTEKFRIMPKGRRCGYTHGCASYLMSDSFGKTQYILWVDTIHNNIDRYVERYFLPYLRTISPNIWDWKQQRKEMRLGNTTIDFRSADRAENIEGFGYHKILLNEAGIILAKDKGRYLWNNALVPMMADYSDCTVFIGGTPKGKTEAGGQFSQYYELAQRGFDENEKNWYAVTVATDENGFLSHEAVEEVRNQLPSGVIRDQEFYGKFVDAGAGIIKGEWFRYSDSPVKMIGRARAWDMAVTVKTSSDYSAGAKCGFSHDNKFYIEDIQHVKMIWPDLKRHIIETAWKDGQEVTIILEKAGQQVGYIDDLRRTPELNGFTIRECVPWKDKLSRAMPWVAAAEGGMVYLVRGNWNQGFISEAESFTANDSHAMDDRIDAVSMCYKMANRSSARMIENVLM